MGRTKVKCPICGLTIEVRGKAAPLLIEKDGCLSCRRSGAPRTNEKAHAFTVDDTYAAARTVERIETTLDRLETQLDRLAGNLDDRLSQIVDRLDIVIDELQSR